MVSLRSVGAFCLAALELLNDTGYGIWAVAGAALAFNQNLGGRGGVLVILLVGLVFIAVGHTGTVLAGVGPRRWRAVMRLLDGSRPRPETLLALVTFVIMLALAGLVRGDNEFWATRMVGALLPISCVVTLLAAPQRRYRTSPPLRLRPGGLLATIFCGGLWLWLIITLQDRPMPQGHVTPLSLALLTAGLAAALSIQAPVTRPLPDDKLNYRLAILMGFAAPCVLIVVTSLWHKPSVLALLAVLSCQIGLSINETLYVRTRMSGSRRSRV